jgi:sodium/hydrogen exchanger 8
MMLLCPWVSYLIAEGLELSGIVAILVNGIFLNYYATPNISTSSKRVIKIGYETIAYSAETVVFLFLGMGLFAFNHPYKETGILTIFTTIVNLNIARFLNIWVVSWMVNKSRTTSRLNGKTQFVMWVSGLRGAMAYALSMKSTSDFVLGPVMLILTLIYSLISILIVGSILNPVMEKCDVKRK